METIKVQMLSKESSYAFGKTLGGERAFIKNGCLIEGMEATVAVVERKKGWISAEILETFEAMEWLDGVKTKDGLIHTKNIEIIRNGLFRIKGKLFFPNWYIRNIIDYVGTNPELWAQSKLALTTTAVVHAGAMVFGITFKQAITRLQHAGMAKARLYCEKKHLFSSQGVEAEMLALIGVDDNGECSIEIWQGIEDTEQVFYAHGILTAQRDKFNHFDCALIDYNIADKERLFNESKKIKGKTKNKLYRIDGNPEGEDIEPAHIYEIANRFFPLDGLVDEYFEIERLDS